MSQASPKIPIPIACSSLRWTKWGRPTMQCLGSVLDNQGDTPSLHKIKYVEEDRSWRKSSTQQYCNWYGEVAEPRGDTLLTHRGLTNCCCTEVSCTIIVQRREYWPNVQNWQYYDDWRDAKNASQKFSTYSCLRVRVHWPAAKSARVYSY